MYQSNMCSPIWDYSPGSGFNVRVIRFLLLTNLFLLYIMYMIIHLILRKSLHNLKDQDSGQRLYQRKKFTQNWERQFMLTFGDHIVAVGFVISFSPYQFELILSFLFVILKCIYEVLLQKYQKTIKPIKTILRIINLGMLICAIVGLSRTQYDKQHKFCRDFDYRIP